MDGIAVNGCGYREATSCERKKLQNVAADDGDVSVFGVAQGGRRTTRKERRSGPDRPTDDGDSGRANGCYTSEEGIAPGIGKRYFC